MKIKVKYFNKDIKPLEMIPKGDWCDLRAGEEVKLDAFEFRKVRLGVGMILPEGYEALVAPRGSTYPDWGIIIVNSPGVVDECYKGNGDEWKCAVLAIRPTTIKVNDRICQFRIQKKQPRLEFVEVEELEAVDRGGFGSTGRD